MTMYWIYDLPNWLLGVLIVAFFVSSSIAGLLLTRPLRRKPVGSLAEHNDLINYFFAALGVLYGLAMGLIAVGTWENLTEVDDQLSQEAASLAGLYRDLDGYAQPLRGVLEGQLRAYTQFVIERDWHAHRQGEVDADGALLLERFENDVMQFEPANEREKILHAEVVRALSEMIKQRGLRLQSVGTGLPAAIWYVVLIGAALTIGLTYLFRVETFRLHALLVGVLATFIGLLIFLTAAMDNPFRGEFSVSSDAFRAVLDKVMTLHGGASPSK